MSTSVFDRVAFIEHRDFSAVQIEESVRETGTWLASASVARVKEGLVAWKRNLSKPVYHLVRRADFDCSTVFFLPAGSSKVCFASPRKVDYLRSRLFATFLERSKRPTVCQVASFVDSEARPNSEMLAFARGCSRVPPSAVFFL